MKQGAFASTGSPHNGYNFALLYMQVYSLKYPKVAVRFCDIFSFQHVGSSIRKKGTAYEAFFHDLHISIVIIVADTITTSI